MQDDIRVRRAELTDIEALAEVTLDCVHGGASIGFMEDFSEDQARAFWRGCLESAIEGIRIILVATDSGNAILGTAQLILATAENQPHRADVAKVQVRTAARRRGIAKLLMMAIEDEAARSGRWLLVLDTVTNSSADRLYRSLGWVAIGEIPDYALWPDGRLCATTVFYKQLTETDGSRPSPKTDS